MFPLWIIFTLTSPQHPTPYEYRTYMVALATFGARASTHISAAIHWVRDDPAKLTKRSRLQRD
jgi:hypothetical protein